MIKNKLIDKNKSYKLKLKLANKTNSKPFIKIIIMKIQ